MRVAYPVLNVAMLRVVAVLTFCHSVVGDECAVVQKTLAMPAAKMEDGFESFCDHSGICDALFVSDSGDVKIGDGGALFHPLSCEEAFAHLNPLSLMPVPSMPNVVLFSDAEVACARASDEGVRYFRALFYSEPWLPVDDFRGFPARKFPPKFAAHMDPIRSALGAVAGAFVRSFPRVNQVGLDPDWIRDLGAHADAIGAQVEAQRELNQTRSILHGSDNVIMMALSVRVILQRMMTEQDEKRLAPFVAAASPFLHAFWYLQASLGLHFPNLYDGMQAALVLVTQTTPPHDAEWKLALSSEEIDSRTYPELPLMRSMTDWNKVLLDVKVVPDLNVAKATLAELFTEMLGADAPWLETGKRIAVLFAYLDAHDVVVADICNEFFPLVNELLRSADLIPPGLRIQCRAAVLNRCKLVLHMRTRLSQVNVIMAKMTHRTQLCLAREDPVQSLIVQLAMQDIYTLAGQIHITVTPSGEDASTALSGGVHAWFGEAISQLFSGHSELFKTHLTADGCALYRPVLTGDSKADRERQIGVGRFLAIYIRQGFDVTQLAPFMQACGEPDVSTVLFFGSDAIRKGFYDVFVESDLERALIDGEDVAEMLEFLASQPPGFFPVGTSSILTL